MIKGVKRVIGALVLSIMISGVLYEAASLALGKVELSKKKVILTKGKIGRLKLKSAKSKKVKWKSSNSKIVTVRKGVIKARKKGKCYIVARYEGKKYVCNVKVKGTKKTTKPTASALPVSSSASSLSSPVPEQEAAGAKVKLTVDSFDQETKKIKYSIINLTDNVVSLPTYYFLEKYENDMWRTVPRKTNSVRALAMLLMPADKLTREDNLNNDYENLSAGKYRIGIEESKSTGGIVFAEFEIF